MATGIEWTDEVWNPVHGCTKVSAGCQNCYAERMAKRLKGRCGYPADDPFRVTLRPDRLGQLDSWQKPRMVFVCSMGDLFHEAVPFGFIAKVMGRIHGCQKRYGGRADHTFQILTKRPARMCEFFEWYLERVGFDAWPREYPHVWLGTSVENQAAADERVPHLLNTPAAVRFLSCEPLLGPVYLGGVGGALGCYTPDTAKRRKAELWMGSKRRTFIPAIGGRGLHWVIAGGESGPGARPMHPDWARGMRDQCQRAGVPFFMKQMGGVTDKRAKLDDLPEDLRCREYPNG